MRDGPPRYFCRKTLLKKTRLFYSSAAAAALLRRRRLRSFDTASGAFIHAAGPARVPYSAMNSASVRCAPPVATRRCSIPPPPAPPPDGFTSEVKERYCSEICNPRSKKNNARRAFDLCVARCRAARCCAESSARGGGCETSVHMRSVSFRCSSNIACSEKRIFRKFKFVSESS